MATLNQQSNKEKEAENNSPLRACRECNLWQDVKQKLRISELLLKAIDGFESRMRANDFSPTVAEYLKLVQMEKELDGLDDSPKEIKVTWVEPAGTSETAK